MSVKSSQVFMTAGLFTVLLMSGCGKSVDQSSGLKGLAHSDEGNNVAVLIGAPNGLPGVPTDIRELDVLFRSSELNLGFDDVVKDDKATTRDIFSKTAEASVGADTLFWYFSGHGNRGVMLAEDRSFTFSEVAEAIIEARESRPLARLVVMIDSCYSGSFVDGRTPIIPSAQTGIRSKCMPMTGVADAEDPLAELSRFEGSLFDQAFVLTSSTKNETSADLGRSRGGAFTWALRGVMTSMKVSNSEATILEISEKTRTDTRKIGGHTPVWRGFPSDVVLNDKFFLYE